jgi:8-oxo-dGTP pyrophosphatase MutT (NUDIX family)
MSQEKAVFEIGKWGDVMSWELIETSEVAPAELTTGAFCVAIAGEHKIILARSERGWGLLGGHREDETVAQAAIRESKAEGGFTPDDLHPFAVRKVVATKLVPHQDPTKFYPFPTSYLQYYWSTTSLPLEAPYGEEIIESRSFTLSETEELRIPDYPIIKLGFEAFLQAAQE